jgi:hypothetical protein
VREKAEKGEKMSVVNGKFTVPDAPMSAQTMMHQGKNPMIIRYVDLGNGNSVFFNDRNGDKIFNANEHLGVSLSGANPGSSARYYSPGYYGPNSRADIDKEGQPGATLTQADAERIGRKQLKKYNEAFKKGQVTETGGL